jgi:hypothetical protein
MLSVKPTVPFFIGLKNKSLEEKLVKGIPMNERVLRNGLGSHFFEYHLFLSSLYVHYFHEIDRKNESTLLKFHPVSMILFPDSIITLGIE